MLQRQYICCERAHFMCPNMSFGILITLDAECDIEKIKTCCRKMSEAHPFLRSVMSYDDDNVRVYYNISDHSMIEINVRDSEKNLNDALSVLTTEWDIMKNGLLKLFVFPAENGMKILFAAHHLLGDGKCILSLCVEFADLYTAGIEPVYVAERLISKPDDLPPKSELSGISRYIVRSANKKWRKENTSVKYNDYLSFSEIFSKQNPVSYEHVTVDPETFQSIKNCCKENNITINDLLMARLYIAAKINKIIIAADIRNKLSFYQQGAYGNYATALGIVSKSRCSDEIKKAKEIHNLVSSSINNNRKLMQVLSCYIEMDEGLIDAAAISALGGYDSKAGKFVGQNMFGFLKRESISITNLGIINNENIKEAIFIPPSSPAARQTVGILTLNNKMQLCSSYYNKLTSTDKLKKILNAMASPTIKE